MDDELQQEPVADLEQSVGDDADGSQSDQTTGDQETGKPRIWQTVRGLQKSIDEIRKAVESKAQTPAQPQPPAPSQPDLQVTDMIALSKANIDVDDIPEVLDYAKYKGIPVAEALKSSVIQTTIRERAEERRSAEIANTGKTKSSKAQISDDALLEMAEKGTLPEDVDFDKLVRARIAKAKAK